MSATTNILSRWLRRFTSLFGLLLALLAFSLGSCSVAEGQVTLLSVYNSCTNNVNVLFNAMRVCGQLSSPGGGNYCACNGGSGNYEAFSPGFSAVCIGPDYGSNLGGGEFAPNSYEITWTVTCNGVTESGSGSPITVGCGGLPPCYTNLTWHVANTDSVFHRYYAQDNIAGTQGPGWGMNPGDSRYIAASVPCADVPYTSLEVQTSVTFTPNPNGSQTINGVTGDLTQQGADTGLHPSSASLATGGSMASTPDTNAPVQPVSPPALANNTGQYNTTNNNVTGANSPILYTSTTNVVLSQQQGDAALYTAVVNGFNQAHGDANGISSDIVTGLAAVVSAINGSTNGTGTNSGAGYSMPASDTNYAAATASVNSQLSGAETAWNANKARMIGPGFVEGSDSPGDMTLHVVSNGQDLGVMDFNPLHNTMIASVFALAKRFLAWLLVLAYFTKVIKDTIETVTWLADAKTRTVAPLETTSLLGVTNVVGLASSLAGSVVVMLVWSAVLAVLLVWTVAGFDVFGIYSTNPLAGGLTAYGGPSGALGLAEAFFPFGVFFALSTAYITWRMTYGFALLVGLATIRLLVGG